MPEFVALIRKEENTDYWVDIPDLPGCISYGKTEDEAKANFKEALNLHLEAMQKDGQSLPQPRSRNEVLSTEEDPYITDYAVEVDAL